LRRRGELSGKRCQKNSHVANWIEMNNIMHSFEVPDQENPQMLEIRKQLKQMVIQADE